MSGFDVTPVGRMLVDLVAAAVLGGAIGAQRQVAHKPAGFRTHLLVCVGSCAFMEISRLAGDMRVAAGVITGIGFLGAGSIVREGSVPHGLTTAASIWGAAAVGLALGYGRPSAYALALVATMLILGALVTSDAFLSKLFPPKESAGVRIVFDVDALAPEALLALLSAAQVNARDSARFAVARVGERRLATWDLTLRSLPNRHLRTALIDLCKNPAVEAVDAAGAPGPSD